MDVLAVDYVVRRRDSKRQGAAAPASMTPSKSTQGKMILAAALASACGASYLSWTSNGVINDALFTLSPRAVSGGFVQFIKAVSAFFSGISYLLYYLIFKNGRVKALKQALAVKKLY